MTRKDYEAVAEAIAKTQFRFVDGANELIESLIGVFRRDNPRFNPDKFRAACHRPVSE